MHSKQADSIQNLLNSTTIYWLGLFVALVGLAVIVHRLRVWYRGGDDPADEEEKIVRQMQELNRQGDLTDEEFRSIKSRVSRRDEH